MAHGEPHAIVISHPLAPDAPAALELEMMAAAANRPATLLIYSTAGRLVSLGRYHRWSGPSERGGVRAARRLTGGRIWGGGAGWLGVALVASPDLVLRRERPGNLRFENDNARLAAGIAGERVGLLRPEQMMNRFVRGIMRGLGAMGLKCLYPGRDSVTVGGRQAAFCSIDIEDNGAILFEAALALDRTMDSLPKDLELLDPEGELVAPMYDAGVSTTVARELGRKAGFAEMAGAIVDGYAMLLGEFRLRDLTATERARAAALAGYIATAAPAGGPSAGLPQPPGRRVLIGRIRGQLGFVEAAITLAGDETVERLQLSGDFVANPAMPARLEREMRGRRLEPAAVADAVAKATGDGSNFLLGLGETQGLVRLLMDAR